MAEALDVAAADASRLHTEAIEVRHRIEVARHQVAGLLGARPREVVFTASATESLNTAIAGLVRRSPGPAVVTAAEHRAVTEAAATWTGLAAESAAAVVTVGICPDGRVDPAALVATVDELIAAGRPPAMVACQLANHEVGAIQPIAEIASALRDRRVPLVVDAAQAAGRIPIDAGTLDATMIAVSGHKLGGPAGTGALVVRRGVRVDPLLVGTAQERDRRAGVENLVGIAGLGAACEAVGRSLDDEATAARHHTATISDLLAELDGVELFGPTEPGDRLPHLVCAGFADLEPQAVLLGLDRAGIAAHSGSACAAEEIEPSPILAAMGADAARSLRFGVGWSTTERDIGALREVLPRVVSGLRALRPK